MSFAAVLPALEATHHGLSLNWSTRLEESVRAGRNSYFIASFQLHQSSKALAFADKALKAAGAQPTILALRVVVYLTPILLAILTKVGISNDLARSAVLFIQNHLGNLCHVVAAVSSVAMIYFGSTLFGVTALTLLGIGLLDRHGLLPRQMRRIIHLCSPVILIGTSVFFGNLLDRIFIALTFSLYAYNFYCYLRPSHTNYRAPTNCLSYENLKNMMQNRSIPSTVTINRKYVNESIPLQAPDCDIRKCVKAFDAINWETHASALRKKIESDKKFQETLGDPTKKTNQELIAFAQKSLKGFIESVINKRILEGEPLDYERLHNYLKVITAHLPKEKDEITKTDILFRLAIEGGSYCGPGKYEVSESIYASLAGKAQELPFRVKVLSALQDQRNKVIEFLYTFEVKTAGDSIGQLVDFQDVHIYNTFRNLYGEDKGLRKGGADNDSLAVIDPLRGLIINYTFGLGVNKAFWQVHDQRIIGETKEAIGTSRLPKPEFYQWWRDWIQRQNIESSTKQALEENLSNGSLLGVPLENASKIDDRFILAMLIDMGVLQRPASGQ
ncbi:MAG: hypothetical protein KR126chlam1_01340 [Chlamydiae bacterium]|nr:hypothetical protein [Chlamydiota bacterium]